jgi:hypothetical protein
VFKKLAAIAALTLGLLLVSYSVAAATNTGQVCEDNGTKVDVVGSHTSITVTAPEGYLISGYCVKAGSTKQGLGPEYVTVDPPAASVVITHSSGKDISHYTITLEAVPSPPTTTTPPPTSTIPPTTVTVPPTTSPCPLSGGEPSCPTPTTPPTSTVTVPVTSAPPVIETTLPPVLESTPGTVASPVEPPASLAYTGFPTTTLLVVGALLALVGVGLLFGAAAAKDAE